MMMDDNMDEQLELQEQEQGEQQQQRQLVDPLTGHLYLEFPPESESAGRCAKLRKMHVDRH
ncbi:hypothetical protein Hanom_Chr06g00536921 [Helianthus anomalus]